MSRAAVILAAGMGTRMKSVTPKVMHKVAGLPILGHIITTARAAGVTRIVVVTSSESENIRTYAAGQGAQSVIQDRQLGTGHAAAAAASALGDFSGDIVVCFGDMPLMEAATLKRSFAACKKGLAVVAFRSQNTAYGRVIADADGMLDRIVEYRDANADERKVELCNAGILCADARDFFRWTAMLKADNAQQEYYLTDVPAVAKCEGHKTAIVVADETEMMGVNSRTELAAAEAAMQQRLRSRALEHGVGFTAPETVFLAHDTVLEADAQIGPHVFFDSGVIVRSGAVVQNGVTLQSGVTVERGVMVPSGVTVPRGATLRSGATMQIKNSNMIYSRAVFLSYSHADKPFCRRLAKSLSQAGIYVWLDEGEIMVGQLLIEKLTEAIGGVDFVVAVISKSSVASNWVQKELDLAMNHEIRQRKVKVLPVLRDEVELPGFLNGKFFADFRTSSAAKKARAKLIESIVSL